MVHTWAHVAGRSAGRSCHLARGRKTKVRDKNFHISALRRDQDILWLQIPVVDPTRVAEVEPIDDLDKDVPDQLVFSEEGVLLDDGVEIASTEVVDEEHVVARIDLAMEGKDVGVERNFFMEISFAGYVVGLLYALDSIVRSGACVDGAINNTERTRTQNRLDPQCTVIDRLAQKPGHRRRIRHCKSGSKEDN